MRYTRNNLIALCERAIVHEDRWINRDSCQAHTNVGRAWAWMKAGVPFKVSRAGSLKTDEQTVWLEFSLKGFDCFEGGDRETETAYLPTEKRLADADGGDWY